MTQIAPTRGISDTDIFVSLCFFFANYSFDDRGFQSPRSELRFLPKVYGEASPDSTISAAVTALTLSFLSLWRGLGPDSDRSQHHMNRAISYLRRDLSSPSESQSDETLLAIMMLQFRDTIIGSSKIQNKQDAHQRGAYAIVRHRRSIGFQSPLSKQLIRTLRISAVFDSLRFRTEVDTTLDIWRTTEVPDDPHDVPSCLSVRVANLQADFEAFTLELAKRLPHKTLFLDDDSLGRLSSFKTEALLLDRDLVVWSEAQDPLWKPVTVPVDKLPSSVREAGVYLDRCQIYPSVSIAGIWHMYRLQRSITLKIIIKCMRTRHHFRNSNAAIFEQFSLSEPQIHEDMLQELFDDLCAAVPYHLGSRNGPGNINEYGQDTKVGLAFDSAADPWRNIRIESNGDAFLSATDRKREVLALGSWHIIGPLGVSVRLVNEPIDLLPLEGPTNLLSSLLREGQCQWILGQIRRVLILLRIIRQDSNYLKL